MINRSKDRVPTVVVRREGMPLAALSRPIRLHRLPILSLFNALSRSTGFESPYVPASPPPRTLNDARTEAEAAFKKATTKPVEAPA